MRTFTMFRPNVPDATHNADQKNAPDQPQFQGVVFDDGTVSIRWMTAKRSTSLWASMEDMLAIHGHPEYGSILRWDCPTCPTCPDPACHTYGCLSPSLSKPPEVK